MTTSEPEADGGNTEALDRSREAIDEARDSVRDALKDTAPDLDGPGTGSSSESTPDEPAPRPS